MALLPQRQTGLLPRPRTQLLPLDMGASVRAEAEGHQQRFGAPQGAYIPFPTMPTWQQVMQYAKEHPLDALAGVTAPIPLLGDATGLLADSVEMAQNPSATNAMLLGVGAATMAPSGAAGRMAKALFGAGNDAAGTVKRIGGGAGDVAKALPTDQASRMARAKEQGYLDDVLYHATDKDFDAFKIAASGTGVNFGVKGQNAIFLTTSPAVADSYHAGGYVRRDSPSAVAHGTMDMGDNVGRWYSEGSQTMPVMVKNIDWDNYDVYDFHGGAYDEKEITKAIKQAKKDKKRGVMFRGITDPGIMDATTPIGSPRKPSTILAVFDPSDIRSVHAQFDPAKKNSADLLAGVGAGGLLGLGAYNRLSAEEEY